MADGSRLSETNASLRPYRGVGYDHLSRKWRARFYCLGHHVTLGRYASIIEAAKCHDRAAYHVFGREAITNFGIKRAMSSLARFPPTASARAMAQLDELAKMFAQHSNNSRVRQHASQAVRKRAAIAAGLVAGVQLAGDLNSRRPVSGLGGTLISPCVQVLVLVGLTH